MSETTCETCPWWAQNEGSKYPSGQSVPPVTEYGECRIYPPSQRWPRTHEADWCGEHPRRKTDAERAPLKTPNDYDGPTGRGLDQLCDTCRHSFRHTAPGQVKQHLACYRGSETEVYWPGDACHYTPSRWEGKCLT